MSRIMRKPAFCTCENKGADQLCGNLAADKRLCLCYINSIIPLLPKCEMSSLYPSSFGCTALKKFVSDLVKNPDRFAHGAA